MPTERTPLLQGPNGERSDDPQTEEALLARWLGPAPMERLGEFTYSLWKIDKPLAPRPPRFSRLFVVGTVVGCVALVGGARVAADRIRAGDMLTAQIAPFALLALFCGIPLGAIVVRSRQRERLLEGTPTPPPPGVPAKAIPAIAGSNDRGRCVGWLWFEGDRLLFQGAGFDFRLRREDFETKGSVPHRLAGKEGAALRRPEGIASHRLRLKPGRLIEGTFTVDPKRWEELRDDRVVWESGAYSAGASLFPPLRPAPAVRTKVGWTHGVVPPLAMGALLGGAALFLPIEPRDGSPKNPLGLAFAGALFGLMWPLLLWNVQAGQRAKEREVEALAREQG